MLDFLFQIFIVEIFYDFLLESVFFINNFVYETVCIFIWFRALIFYCYEFYDLVEKMFADFIQNKLNIPVFTTKYKSCIFYKVAK